MGRVEKEGKRDTLIGQGRGKMGRVQKEGERDTKSEQGMGKRYSVWEG